MSRNKSPDSRSAYLGLRLHAESKSRLQDLARAQGVTMSEAARNLLDKALAETVNDNRVGVRPDIPNAIAL